MISWALDTISEEAIWVLVVAAVIVVVAVASRWRWAGTAGKQSVTSW